MKSITIDDLVSEIIHIHTLQDRLWTEADRTKFLDTLKTKLEDLNRNSAKQ